MSDYAITGKKGTGKTKLVVSIIQRALADGLRVATNLDLKLEFLMESGNRSSVLRIPDKPTAADLFAIGHGNPDSYDEDKNGILVLDELGTWFNARNFQDKTRQPILDWLIHARKHGWHVYYLMQGVNQVDKQLREALFEYVGRCIRFDKVRIPLLGGLLSAVSFGLLSGRLPRFHLCNIRMGVDPTGILIDRILYRHDALHSAFDTRQVFSEFYSDGIYSMLSAWHLKGRYLPKHRSWLKRLQWWPDPKPKASKPISDRKCAPLFRLEPPLRWAAARQLVQRGYL